MELQEKDSAINADYEPSDGVITKEDEVKRQKDLQNGISSSTVSPPTAGPTYVHTNRSDDCCCLWCWVCADSHTHSAHYHSHHPDHSGSSGCCDDCCDCDGCCDCSCDGCCGGGDCDCDCGDCGDCNCDCDC